MVVAVPPTASVEKAMDGEQIPKRIQKVDVRDHIDVMVVPMAVGGGSLFCVPCAHHRKQSKQIIVTRVDTKTTRSLIVEVSAFVEMGRRWDLAVANQRKVRRCKRRLPTAVVLTVPCFLVSGSIW